MKLAGTLLLTAALATGIAVAQDATASTPSTQPSAKQDMKDAGHATKKTTKKVVHKSASKTEEGAAKVENKTTPQ